VDPPVLHAENYCNILIENSVWSVVLLRNAVVCSYGAFAADWSQHALFQLVRNGATNTQASQFSRHSNICVSYFTYLFYLLTYMPYDVSCLCCN